MKDEQRPLAETPSRKPAVGVAVDRGSVLAPLTPRDPDAVTTLFALGLGQWCLVLNGKIAASRGWRESGPVDEATVRGWLAAGHNVGVRTGHCSGVVVVDDDRPKLGLDPFDAPPTGLVAASPTGSRHYYYRLPEGVEVRNSTSKLTDKVDVRGEGGYVVAPPSIHPDKREPYCWISTDPPSEMPADLLARLRGEPSLLVDMSAPSGAGYAKAALERELAQLRATPEGKRNHRLNTAAFNLGQLVAGGELERGVVEAALVETALEAGLTEREALATVRSGLDAGGNSPRQKSTRKSRARADDHDQCGEDGRPQIHILAGKLPAAAEEAERLLADASPAAPIIFQRAGALARTIRLAATVEGRVTLSAGTIVIRTADEAFLLDQIARVARIVKYDRHGDGREAHPPKELAAALLSHAGRWPFAHLMGVCESPQMFPDGRIVEREGHDEVSGMLLDFRGASFPVVHARVTRDKGLAALGLLDEALLAGFPFVEAHDRSAALAFLLTSVARGAVDCAPAFGASAPNRSCGKSTLLKLGATLTTGRDPAVIAPGGSEEESDKRILSILRDGVRHVLLDNLTDCASIDAPSFAKVLSEPTYTGRLLGENATATFPTTGVTWSFSGVGLAPRGDTVSRSVLVNLDPKTERPWAMRWASANPIRVAHSRRGELVVAALTALRAFDQCGRPAHGLAPHRFSQWDQFIRGALIWYDRPDPLAGLASMEELDPEAEDLRSLATAWRLVFKARAITVGEVLRVSDPDLRVALQAVACGRTDDALSASRLGKFLARHQRRIIDGWRFMRAGMSGTRALWRLEPSAAVAASAASAGCLTPHHADAQACAHASECDQAGTSCESCATCEFDPQTGEVLTPTQPPHGATQPDHGLSGARDQGDASERVEERAAIIEYDGGLPRAEAERRAEAEVRAAVGEQRVDTTRGAQ